MHIWTSTTPTTSLQLRSPQMHRPNVIHPFPRPTTTFPAAKLRIWALSGRRHQLYGLKQQRDALFRAERAKPCQQRDKAETKSRTLRSVQVIVNRKRKNKPPSYTIVYSPTEKHPRRECFKLAAHFAFDIVLTIPENPFLALIAS